ncbi:MAG TPA: HAD family phosphatase [Bacteroidia bacterium]|nr:MAG: HAD-superfamily hydrolase [Bacteroidetes bacterium OLB10]MBE7508696.1 HAD family phosphatase [Bacteroidia bacterium]MBX3106966.1 HAD family phosphatase [Bacteroidota bacterium]MCE7955887.1 HAD family phosphatase [Bacteroidetes bacterium CHB6]MBV6453501.1 D-ribitol-5-phosphate phosphatase [Bacteroidia bacterium]
MIKNIIFDFGGVLLPIEISKTALEFERLGLSDFENIYSMKKQVRFFDDFEKGNIPASAFRSEIRKHYKRPLSDEEIDFAWNALLGELPPERFNFLKELGEKYNLYLLSNTNSIHYSAFINTLNQTFGKDQFEKLFVKTYYSFQMGSRKPDKRIFGMVIRDSGVNPQETVFIDDNLDNAMAAQNAGLNAIHDAGLEIEKELTAMLSAF